jgi:hypothetical protein
MSVLANDESSDHRGLPWRPDMWPATEGDICPELPPWNAVINMISGFGVDFDSRIVADFSDGRRGGYQVLSTRKYRKTVMTLAYCCVRGLTVLETQGYFGEAAVVMEVCGEIHPVRDLNQLVNQGHGDEPITQFVSFRAGNPLAAVLQ